MMDPSLIQCPLFQDMSQEDISKSLACSGALIRSYPKDEIIFSPGDRPRYLPVLLEGSVIIGNYSPEGRRSVVGYFQKAGEIFGEVFLFLKKDSYEHFALAAQPCRLLLIPKEFLYQPCSKSCSCHTRITYNLMGILADKAYFLNQRVQVLASPSLRQKIARALLMHTRGQKEPVLHMGREELADYLNAARPSVSRELSWMEQEGLVALGRKEVRILSMRALAQLLE